jgi:hypothetical protein
MKIGNSENLFIWKEVSECVSRDVNIKNYFEDTYIQESCFVCVLKMHFGNRALTYDTFDVCTCSYTIPLCLD